MVKQGKENPKWREESIVATCKTCGRLYIADKMLRQKFPTKDLVGKEIYGSFHYWYFCNDGCFLNYKEV